MATAHCQPLTAQDYRELPEGGPRYQLVEGDLYMSPSPTWFHQVIAINISRLIGNHVARQPIGKVVAAPLDVYLDEINVVQPDVLFISNANADIIHEDGVHGAPDLVIEILSPTTAQLDKKSKRHVYARTGVKELWMVDPILLQIHRYDLRTNPEKALQIIEENESFESPLLPGLTVAAAEVFRR